MFVIISFPFPFFPLFPFLFFFFPRKIYKVPAKFSLSDAHVTSRNSAQVFSDVI